MEEKVEEADCEVQYFGVTFIVELTNETHYTTIREHGTYMEVSRVGLTK